MDKKLILAVAGSGKTTHIVNQLSEAKRTLILTYTIGNYNNLCKKTRNKFNGIIPYNITIMTYFPFLYGFCYKPFLSDIVNAKGIIFEQNPNQYASKKDFTYFLTPKRYFYSNRLAFFLEEKNTLPDIKTRIETYFDQFIIDEIQDIGGRDFNFLKNLMKTNIEMLFVGDFFQHTFDTSRDGNVNKSLYENKDDYEREFTAYGFEIDTKTLNKSWRCNSEICKFINDNLGIDIQSHYEVSQDKNIYFIDSQTQKNDILGNNNIIKLHYQNSSTYGNFHKNWGDVKGEDCYNDICVMLNKATAKLYPNKLSKLSPSTKNKLYVAITRARNNVYLMKE